jgi:thiol-disulfide isomerase/thioredoxin
MATRSYGAGLLIGLAAAVLATALVGALMSRPGGCPMPGFLAPPKMEYDWQLRRLDGEMLDVADLRGKVLFVNLWATWCPPCIAEMPSIQRLYDGFRDSEDVAFLLICAEDAQMVRAFLAENGYDLPVYQLTDRPPEALRTRGIPATFIISRTGAIARKRVGAAHWDAPKVVSFLRELAEHPPPSPPAGPEGAG